SQHHEQFDGLTKWLLQQQVPQPPAMHTKALTAAVALLPLCAGVPLDARHGPTSHSDEPCKQVHDHMHKWMSDNGIVPKDLSRAELLFIPSVPAVPIPPSLAFACIRSVPLHKDSALQQLDFLRPLFGWQSTVDYLRDPPQGYLSEPVDLIGGLDDIAAKLKTKGGRGYANEYEFLADLYTLTSVRVRDFHFHYSTLLLDLFTPLMGAEFVSISKDGVSTPKIYLYGDVKNAQQGYTPSPVSTIDGVPALEYLQKVSVYDGASHDPDARFNALFRSLSNDRTLAYTPPTWPLTLDIPDTTTGNATERAPIAWQYHLLADKNFTSTYAGYPKVTKAAKFGELAGFLPDSPGLSDAAVLSVNSFTTVISPDTLTVDLMYPFIEFYNVTIDFLVAAKASNRSKLILDVQGNGGGMILNLAVLYFALFPGNTNILPVVWQGRAHPQLAWLGKQLWNTSDPHSPWPFTTQMKADGTPWASFEEFFGPYPGPGTLFNLSTEATRFVSAINSTSSYPSLFPWTEPPFHPNDIIIVTDGECGSACAIFTGIMTHEHSVRTVALGGRPLHAPMQAAGQTRGGPINQFSSFPWDEEALLSSPPPEGLDFIPPMDFVPPLRVADQNERLGWSVADTLPLSEYNRDGEQGGGVPLQFRYEAANCRLFFTWAMATDITAVWEAVAGAAWYGGKCAVGSTTNADGTMGGVPKYSKKVEDQYRLGKGPGAMGGK
ncbi:hypothetical protein C8A00DRAFT_38847, partial [Chaetomidium leptoderma]